VPELTEQLPKSREVSLGGTGTTSWSLLVGTDICDELTGGKCPARLHVVRSGLIPAMRLRRSSKRVDSQPEGVVVVGHFYQRTAMTSSQLRCGTVEDSEAYASRMALLQLTKTTQSSYVRSDSKLCDPRCVCGVPVTGLGRETCDIGPLRGGDNQRRVEASLGEACTGISDDGWTLCELVWTEGVGRTRLTFNVRMRAALPAF
jgi:hypothetical protein